MNCLHCGQPRPQTRSGKYCCGKCRAAASRERRAPTPGTIRAVRILKDGTQQVIAHVKPLWRVRAARGDEIVIGVP